MEQRIARTAPPSLIAPDQITMIMISSEVGTLAGRPLFCSAVCCCTAAAAVAAAVSVTASAMTAAQGTSESTWNSQGTVRLTSAKTLPKI